MPSTQDSKLRDDVFSTIRSNIAQKCDVGDDHKTPTMKLLGQAQRKFPSIKDLLTYRNYVQYKWEQTTKDMDAERQRIKTCDSPNLWHSLQYNPLTDSNDANAMSNFLANTYFPTIIELGKLDGKIPLRFAPGTHSFEDDTIICPPAHERVSTGMLAVGYHHHPSTGPTQTASGDDGKLRRFKEVGSILAEDLHGWNRTGHVLVIDMDEGRNRHPWIILASAWQVEDEYSSETVRAPKNVGRNNTRTSGIFLGHSNRTTIGRLTAISSKPNPTPLLLQFGPSFNFRLDEFGYRYQKGMSFGPQLAHVMPWVKQLGWRDWRQVCYVDNDGKQEYMRYEAKEQRYYPPQTQAQAHEQQQPELRKALSYSHIPLPARFRNPQAPNPPSPTRKGHFSEHGSPQKSRENFSRNRPSSSGIS
ncbi:MAG: hypothetical protein Q9180_004206 [Flavoplaca navasiana]